MKTLQDLIVERKELSKKIKEYTGLEEFSDQDLKSLNELKAQALKTDAQISIREESEKADKALEEERETAFQAKVAEATKKAEEQVAAKARRLPYREAPYQAQYSETWKYDNMDGVDLALLLDMEKSLGMKQEPAALKAMSLRVAELKETANTEDARQEVAYVKGSFKAATGIDPTPEAVGAAVKAATDPMYTGGSNIGSDWVGTAYSTSIWNKIRQTPAVVGKIPSEVIPDGYSNKTWPLESTDVTWYTVAETSAVNASAATLIPAPSVTASQMATANKNITVAKLGARAMYSGELEEDSLIRFSPQLRAQFELSGAEMLESLVIDGDTETSSSKNINANDTAVTTEYFLAFNGFRKLPLVTNTANSLSAGGGLLVTDFLDLLKLMGTAGIAGSDPTKVSFICDGNTYYAMAKLPEVLTKDVNSAATVENGFVKSLWSVGVIPSWQMHRNSATRHAMTTGYIDANTAGNNTRGACVAVRWDQWKLAYKRRMTMETTRIANADTWEIVAWARLGMGYRDTEASAILYNIGV
jgi:hypothetical protein